MWGPEWGQRNMDSFPEKTERCLPLLVQNGRENGNVSFRFFNRIATKDFNQRWVLCSQTTQICCVWSTLKQTWSRGLVHNVQKMSLGLQKHSILDSRSFYRSSPETETCCCKLHRTNWWIVEQEHIMAGREHETSASIWNHNLKHQHIHQWQAAGRPKVTRYRRRSELSEPSESPIVCSDCGERGHNCRANM